MLAKLLKLFESVQFLIRICFPYVSIDYQEWLFYISTYIVIMQGLGFVLMYHNTCQS